MPTHETAKRGAWGRAAGLVVSLSVLIVLLAGCFGGTTRSYDDYDDDLGNGVSALVEKAESNRTEEADASTDSEEETDTSLDSGVSAGERNALESANQYLRFTAFSYSGLIDQLEFEGYSSYEATYAADHCGADWYEQAALLAAQYLSTMAFSREGLIDQLEYEGFTYDQAVYGVEQTYDSEATSAGLSDFASSTDTGAESSSAGATMGERNALQSAESYLSFMAFSYSGLIDQLEYEGYSNAEATYAADHCGADWYEQAARSAKEYLDLMSFSRESLIDQLEYGGFTYDQAVYGVEQNGY